MGTGHIMRCIALAQGWQESGGNVHFVISRLSRPLEERITREGFSLTYLDHNPGSREDADETLAVAAQYGAGWIVLDGYQFNGEYQVRIHDGGMQLLVIDDYGHARTYAADIVLNQNAYASMAFYPDPLPRTRFLLGGKYTLLREEFLQAVQPGGDNTEGPVRNILVTMGGSDPDNITTAVLDTLLPMVAGFGITVTAAIGGMNRFFPQEDGQYRNTEKIRIVHASQEMPDLIRQADLAITGAGSTAWEIAFLRKPMIAIVLSENQERVAKILHEAGAALAIHDRTRVRELLGPALRGLLDSPEQRRALGAAAHRLIDGGGVSRVVMAMQGRKVRLRRVTEEDSDLLLAWANDPVVRNNAFSQDTISRHTHEEWFRRKLQSPDTAIFIALDKDDQPAGQVRFDREGDCVEVDISVAASQRGGGLGVEILRLGIAKLFHTTDIKKINASVKSGNIASKKMFEQAGFRCTGTTRTGEAEVFQFAYERG